jgi:PAS domain S-box-containing protein
MNLKKDLLTFIYKWLTSTFKGRAWVAAIAIALLQVIVILIVGYISFKATEKATFNEFNQRQLVMATKVSHGIELYFETLARAMKALGVLPGVNNFDDVAARQFLTLEIHELARLGVNDIGVLDADGLLRYDVIANHLEGEDFSGRAYYHVAKAMNPAGDGYITELIVFKGVDAGKKGILVAVPMFENHSNKIYPSPSEKFVGVVFCTFTIETLTKKFVAPVRSSKRGYTFLIDDGCNILWMPDHSLFGKNLLKEAVGFPSFQQILKRMNIGYSGTAEYSFYRFDKAHDNYSKKKEEKLIAYVPVHLGTERWSLGVWAPKDDARRLIHTAYIKQLLLVGVMIMIILLGPAYSLVMAFRDSTRLEREVQEKTGEFKESHQRLLTVLDRLDAGVYVADMETHKILFVNRYTQNLFGDVMGKICWRVLQTEKSGPCDFCTKEKLLTTEGNPADVTVWEYQDNATEKWYEAHVRAITWLDGRIVKLHIATDITDRKRAEEKLKHNHNHLSALLESLPIVPYTCQANGNLEITYVSNAIKEITGYTTDRFVEDSTFWAENIHPNDKIRILAELPEIFKHSRQSLEYGFRAADGSYKLISDTRTLVRLRDGTMSHIVGTWQDITEKKRLREISLSRMQQRENYDFGGIIGVSPSMQEVYERISRVIEMDVKTVLILGETGTGKDLVAKTIHYQGNRKNHPFTEINCANIPDNLLESELFGHEKGAFTDAKALKRGLFEQAPMGTILLNEIGHMKMDLQAKLLRVIENRKFRRVGGVKELDIDVRLLAATNRDLSEAVGKDEFREDLYYRLRLVPVYMPPLRERKEDIPLLCRHFIQIANREFRKNVQGITNEVEEIFIRYDWPGNVRELKNVIEGAIILGDEDQIQIRHLPREVIKAITDASFEFEFPESGVSMARVEKDLIEQALKKSGGNQMRAASLLDITRHALRHRMKKYGFL